MTSTTERPATRARRLEQDRLWRKAKTLGMTIAEVRAAEAGETVQTVAPKPPARAPEAPVNWSPNTLETGHWEGRYWVMDLKHNASGTSSRNPTITY